jgi:hypothetical protein
MTPARWLSAVGFFFALATGANADAARPWVFRSLGGVVCRAFLPGESVDTQLLRSRDGKLVLIAGFPGKFLPLGDTALTLAIDDAPAAQMTGSAIGGIVLVNPLDDAQASQIAAARTLRWHFPWGDYRADVDGLGAAFDKIAVCPG